MAYVPQNVLPPGDKSPMGGGARAAVWEDVVRTIGGRSGAEPWPLPSPITGGRVEALDGIRGVAVLLVMIGHGVVFGGFSTRSGWDAVFNAGAKTGWVGVDLFFVLSGFLITGILFDTRGSEHYFRTFYVRRFLRIVPVYYAVLLLYCLWGHALIDAAESPELSWNGLAWAATYLSNYPTGLHGWGVLPHPVRHLWSLAIEEQFYLLWPLLVYRVDARRLMTICLVAVGVGWVTRVLLLALSLDIAGYVWTPARLVARRWRRMGSNRRAVAQGAVTGEESAISYRRSLASPPLAGTAWRRPRESLYAKRVFNRRQCFSNMCQLTSETATERVQQTTTNMRAPGQFEPPTDGRACAENPA